MTLPVRIAALGTAFAITALAASPSAAQDAAAGAKMFGARCAMCHGKGGEGGPLAPPLKGVYKSRAASSGSPRNTPALKASKLIWTDANLDAFLTAPKKLVPGTAMYVAIANPADRANLIAHLKTLKK